MVADSFHDFFLGSTSISGALVGLLFVAISVTPAAVTEKVQNIQHRIRAAAAMSAFLNSLLMSLLALVPDMDLSSGAIILSMSGILSTLALLSVVGVQILNRANRRLLAPIQWARAVLWLVVLEVVYVWQFVESLRLQAGQVNIDVLKDLAIIVVLLFALGISRAWELVGPRSARVLASVREATVELREQRELDREGQATQRSEPSPNK